MQVVDLNVPIRRTEAPGLKLRKRIVAGIGVLVVALILAYLLVVASEIRRESGIDEAHKADVIIVLGAAEYRGKPSPVLQARLNHALVSIWRVSPRIL